MAQNEMTTELPPESMNDAPVIDPEKVESFVRKLEAEQNLPLGIAGGAGAAIIGGAIWAIVTVATGYQIGWMAVGVGFLVGYAVRILGKGISSTFGVVGAICALAGCILGNLLTACGFLATQEAAPIFQVVVATLSQPAFAMEMLQVMFSPMDILFYGIAVYEGYRFSFQQIDQELVAELTSS